MPGRYWLLSKLAAALLEHVGDRNDGALGVHHDAGADVEDLHDVRRLMGAEGGDAGLQGLVVGALEHRHDLVVGLAVVEVLGQRLDDVVVGAGHRVPPLDFGGGHRGAGIDGECAGHDEFQRNLHCAGSLLGVSGFQRSGTGDAAGQLSLANDGSVTVRDASRRATDLHPS